MIGTVLSILMLAGIGLIVGAVVLWRRGASRKQAVLMVVAAVVCFINVAIRTLPNRNGDALFDRAEQSVDED